MTHEHGTNRPFPINRTHPPRRVIYQGGSKRLELRPWAIEDTDQQVEALAASQPELRAFMPWAHFPLTRESQFAVVTQFQSDYWAGREFVFGAFDAQGSLVGCAGLHPRTALNPLALELGYWCHSARAGQGWTTLSAQILIALAFDHLGSDRVQVMHDEANTASQRVIEKCGFTFEGVQRNVTGAVSAALVADGYRGTGRHRTYALTPEDLPSLGWLPALRAALTIKDALGGVFPGRPLGT